MPENILLTDIRKTTKNKIKNTQIAIKIVEILNPDRSLVTENYLWKRLAEWPSFCVFV